MFQNAHPLVESVGFRPAAYSLFCISSGGTCEIQYYAHRTFQANFPLCLLIVICQTISLQNDFHFWCRDHRAHHKWSETDADPHNSKRGFFFSQMVGTTIDKKPAIKHFSFNLGLIDAKQTP
ncbi:hypothetical protein TYRP_005247 [Tyrophagus putrescentiae]|nr:hypothetical protein TYRP_005247 [Tyrophagus putrescentiae]